MPQVLLSNVIEGFGKDPSLSGAYCPVVPNAPVAPIYLKLNIIIVRLKVNGLTDCVY